MALSLFAPLNSLQLCKLFRAAEQFPHHFPQRAGIVGALIGCTANAAAGHLSTLERTGQMSEFSMRYSAAVHSRLEPSAPLVALPRKADGSPLEKCSKCYGNLVFCKPKTGVWFYGACGAEEGVVIDMLCPECPAESGCPVRYGLSTVTTVRPGGVLEVRLPDRTHVHPGVLACAPN